MQMRKIIKFWSIDFRSHVYCTKRKSSRRNTTAFWYFCSCLKHVSCKAFQYKKQTSDNCVTIYDNNNIDNNNNNTDEQPIVISSTDSRIFKKSIILFLSLFSCLSGSTRLYKVKGCPHRASAAVAALKFWRLCWCLGMGLGPILECHNAFQLDLAAAA